MLPHTTVPSRKPSALAAALRLATGALHVLGGLLKMRLAFGRMDEAQRSHYIQRWASRLLVLWNIQVRTHGTPAAAPVLIIANHISWLDIVVMLATTPCRFVGKSELSGWPVLGTLMRGVNVIFLARNTKRDALRVVGEVAHVLQHDRHSVLVFPEGTTSDGQAVLPFHANLFEAALKSDTAVQPMGLSYTTRHNQLHTNAPAYVGDDSLLDSVWRTLRAAPFDAQLQFLPPQHAQGRSRRTWADEVRQSIVDTRSQLSQPAHMAQPSAATPSARPAAPS